MRTGSAWLVRAGSGAMRITMTEGRERVNARAGDERGRPGWVHRGCKGHRVSESVRLMGHEVGRYKDGARAR